MSLYDPAYTTCTKIVPDDDPDPVDKPSPNDHPSPDDDASQDEDPCQDDDNQAPADDPAANTKDEIPRKNRHNRTEGGKCREALGQINNLTCVA